MNARSVIRGRRAALVLAVLLQLAAAVPIQVHAQAGFEDDRVLLQGFYWESYRHGHPEKPEFASFGTKHWYAIVRELAPTIRDARFDLIWLPPASFAGPYSAGYNPKQLFKLDSSYGTSEEHRALLRRLLENGVEPVADLVFNHRDGLAGWADFKEPDWGTWAICKTDEAFSNPASGITNASEKGNCEEYSDYQHGTTYNYESFRDLAHSDKRVRDDLIRLMLHLRSIGYRGWRFDMVHGYPARWIACYDAATTPTFAVGEYDWDKHAQQRGWIWSSSTEPAKPGAERLHHSSDVFDFTTQSGLKAINDGRYYLLYGYGKGIGMVGDTTDDLPWKNRAVTFVENHDTGYRTNEDGTPQADHKFDTFANNWQVEQAYAHVLTHPGVPSVYWKHFFDWGQDLQNKLRALINARKVAGVHSGSALYLQENANGVYAARVDGRRGRLYVRIGGSDQQWQPSHSGYADYREYARGAGWAVWVALPGNPAVQAAPVRPALPIPAYRPIQSISVPSIPQCDG